MTTLATRPRRRTGWQLVGYLLKRAFVMELRSYQSIWRLVFRRPRVPVGAVAFSYHQPIMAILVILISVSAVEVVAVDLIVQRWEHTRIPFLVVGIWGLVWMFGLLCGMLTRPHAVGPAGIRVRSGAEVDLPVSWDEIASVSRHKQVIQEKQPKVTVDDRGEATLHLRIGQETNIELELEDPTAFRLPHGVERVSRIALYVEDPKAFMDEVRRHIG